MAAYKTGRSRTITMSGEFSGEAWLGMGLVGSSFSVRVDAYWLGVALPSLTGVYGEAGYVSLDATANAQYGASDSDTDMRPMTTSNNVASGTWAMTIEVEEWVELTESATAPTYGGSAVDGDVPGLTTVRFFEKTKSGGSVHTEIALSDASRSVSASATGTLPGEAELTSYGCVVTLTASSNLDTQTASVEWEYLFADGPTYSESESGIAATAGAESASIAITDALASHNGKIAVSLAPQRAWNLSGVLRADNAAYTGSGTIRVHRKWLEDYVEVSPSAGGYSYSCDQHAHGVSCTLDSVAQASYSLYEWDDVYHWLVPPSGEAANQWRLLLRGAYYDAGTIAQATTVAFDGGFTFGDGGTTRTWSPAKSLAGYRYLLVDTDQAAKDVTLTIGNKTWTVQTNGSGLAIFDLCGPSNLTTDTDARDSRWPIPTDVDTVSGDGCMWGVATIASLTLTAETGVTCTVAANGVYLSRDTWSDPAGHSLLNVVAPHLYWAPSGTANTYKRPLLRGDTDGRRSLEEADWTRVVGTPTIHTAETIEDVFDEVNASDSSVVRNVGWNAVIDTDIDVADGAAGDTWMAPDWALMNRNRNASWIEGAGIAYVNGAWRYPLDVDVSSAYTLIAQMLVDKVTLYPACGDVFGLRDGAHRWEYGDDEDEARAELRAGRYMRGVVWGLVLHTDGTPFDGATVTYKRTSDGAAGGSGSTDMRGEYLTGLPGGLAGETYTARAETGSEPFPSIEALAYGGLRRRCCFTGVPSSLGCIECDGPRQWLHVGYAKRIRTYNLWGCSILWESADYAIDHWLRLRTDPRRGLLLMLSDDGGGTLGLWVSNDGGNTGTEVGTMTASSAAIEVDSERAVYVLLWESGGNVQVQASGDGGTTWSAAQDALYLGAAFSGTVVDMARDARRDVLLLALESGGAISIYGSQDLGLTWELVAS